MKLIAFDSVGGAGGDMILAALIDLGVDREALERALSGLGLGRVELACERAVSGGIGGLRVHVRVEGRTADQSIAGSSWGDDTHPWGNAGRHGGETPHNEHRSLMEIESLIRAAPLPEAARERACRVFRRLGDVEARIHNIPLEEVHFHEIGAADSIADIVGGCLALEMLGIEGVAVGPLPQGCGVIRCEHGIFPNPAPATVELLRGFRILQTDLPVELVTPTAAALFAEWRNLEQVPAGAIIEKIGHGLGHRDLGGRPNMLRAICYRVESSPAADECVVLETNIDDCSPEWLGYLQQKLLEAGALDVFVLPAQMKKQRPGALLTVLCRPETRHSMVDLIFREGITFGIREQRLNRTILERRMETVETPFGPVRVKLGFWKGRQVACAPEYDDCARIAAEKGVPLRAVFEASRLAGRNRPGSACA